MSFFCQRILQFSAQATDLVLTIGLTGRNGAARGSFINMIIQSLTVNRESRHSDRFLKSSKKTMQ